MDPGWSNIGFGAGSGPITVHVEAECETQLYCIGVDETVSDIFDR